MSTPPRFEDVFDLRYPIVQGPMNNASPPALVAAVSNAGGLGFLAASLLSPAAIAATIGKIRTLTPRSFGVNLFVLPPVTATPAAVAAAAARLEPYRQLLGLPSGTVPERVGEDFCEQLEVLVELAPPVVSFTFGIIDASTVRRLQAVGTKVIGTATTVAEARAWDAADVDAICAQGSEAGGHRATFLGDFEQSCVGLMALLPQMRRATRRPIIAAGGVMTGAAIVAARLLGADAVQLGSAFLQCPETGISATWKAQLAQAQDDSTRLTRSFSGRPARGLANRFMHDLAGDDVPDYPVQNALTSELRAQATRLGRPEFMSLWAGQAAGLGRAMPAGDLIGLLAAEAEQARQGLAGWRHAEATDTVRPLRRPNPALIDPTTGIDR